MAGPTGSQKLAVLLCKFQDTAAAEPHPREYFEDLFVNTGTGGLNDYWRAASLGKINLNGTRVLGWNTINQKRADYVAAHPDRWSKILGAFPSFPGFNAADYAGVVAVFNADVGDAGFHNGVLINHDIINATFAAHETGHLFGLEHSFDESDRKNAEWSAPGEYFDPRDIMSAMSVSAAPHERFGSVGPLACAAHLDRLGWLDAARLWTPPTGGSGSYEFDLVSLAHPEIPGYLAARIGWNVYLEFRTPDGFDVGIGAATVLVHQLRDANPVVLASDKTTWNQEWLPGMTYGPSAFELFVRGGWRVEVVSFDLPAKKARLRARYVARRPIVVEGPGQIVGGVAVDGGGFVILPSGKIVKVPPRSPLLEVVSQLALVAEAETVLGRSSFEQVRRTVLADVAKAVDQMRG
jgi:hypothetical protein